MPCTPRSLWIKRCKKVLEQFETLLDPAEAFSSNNKRSKELEKLLEPKNQQVISLVSSIETKIPDIVASPRAG